MGKLRVTTSGLGAVELELEPGVYRVGRSEDNDWRIPHDSVSSHHCVILVQHGQVRVKDLGSTNGTFLDGELVADAPIVPGQRLRLGDVEIAHEAAPNFQLAGGGLSLKAREENPAVASPPGGEFAGRFVARLNRPGPPQPELPPTFFASLPTAFQYPITEGAWLLLTLGTLFFGFVEVSIYILKYLLQLALETGVMMLVYRVGIGLTLLTVFASGYLFAYIQRIIMSTAVGDHRLPDWPELAAFLSDVAAPAFQFAVVWAVCLAPAVLFMLFAPDALTPAAVPLALFGLLYLPMGLLAVALLDTVFALNPLLIVPSILKVPKPYLAVCGVLLLILVFQFLFRVGLGKLIGIPIVPGVITGFFSFYFVCVMVRILGLLYFYHREELNWV